MLRRAIARLSLVFSTSPPLGGQRPYRPEKSRRACLAVHLFQRVRQAMWVWCSRIGHVGQHVVARGSHQGAKLGLLLREPVGRDAPPLLGLGFVSWTKIIFSLAVGRGIRCAAPSALAFARTPLVYLGTLPQREQCLIRPTLPEPEVRFRVQMDPMARFDCKIAKRTPKLART